MTSTEVDSSGKPLSTLRGAGVEVDVRLVARLALGLVFLGVAVLIGVLFLAGSNKNGQITSLRQNGVPVTVTVTRCRGLMGGSGSNAAGYSCDGTLTLDGRRHGVTVPGNSLHAPGARLHEVAVPNDPTLLAAPNVLATEHASGRVFVLPTVLLVLWLFGTGALLLRWRRRRGAPTA